jgi:hypothetical protein
MNSTSTQNTIRQIAVDSPTRRDFYQRFLPLIASETNSVSAIAWNCSSLPYRPICQLQSDAHDVLRIGVSETEHVALLTQAVSQPKSMVVLPKSSENGSATGEKSIENPVILMATIRRPESVDLIEMFLPQGLDESVYDQRSKSLETLCLTAADCEISPVDGTVGTSVSADMVSVKRITPSQLDEYVHQIHRSLDPQETAKQIANEARRVLDCDRVSVISTNGNRQRVVAISGQPSVNRRSNIVHLLRKFAQRVLPTRQSFFYPTEKELPAEIETPLQNYLAVASTRSMIVVPIFDQPPQFQERPDPVTLDPRLIGGLVIEHCGEQWSDSSVSNAIEIVTRHASDAFRNSYNHRQLLFFPLWKWLGKSQVVLAARNLPKTIAAAIGLLTLGLLLAFFPADLKLSCEGILVPVNRSNVFAPGAGTIASIEVTHGSIVQAGQTLVKMVNIDLESRAAELAGRIRELEQDIKTTETLLLSRGLDDQSSGEQNLNAQKAELSSHQRQFELVNQKLKKLNVTSPRDGQVITWNLEDRLKMRPVQGGELLMEVVDVDGDWQLELNLPDQKVGHLLSARAANHDRPLEVEFILAADPERNFNGLVTEIGRTTEIVPDQGQSVRVKVQIENNELDIRQTKSGVTARIVCGKTSLGNSLFHGAREFVQKMWFKYF